jgi:hypothetical protein
MTRSGLLWLSLTAATAASCEIDHGLFSDGSPGDGAGATGNGGTNTGVGAMGGTGASGGTASGTASGGVTCLESAPPQLECDPGCDECVNGICVIRCDANTKDCSDAMIECPEGLACDVECRDGACDGVIVACPARHECFLQCGGDQTCRDAQLQCAPDAQDGVCQMRCNAGMDVCRDAIVTCGQNLCAAQCEEGVAGPELVCGGSCQCTPCAG